MISIHTSGILKMAESMGSIVDASIKDDVESEKSSGFRRRLLTAQKML